MHINKIKTLGIIPARGGSKGVLRKNIRYLAGKHLIGHSIESAQKSEYLTNILVSTDDKEIANISHQYGSTVLIRPHSLAQDDTPMLPVIKHALIESERLNQQKYDYVVILQPTAPLRTANDIDSAIEKVVINKSNSLVSLYRVEDAHPSRMYTIENGNLNKVMNEPQGALRQRLKDVFHRNGCIYISSRDLILNKDLIMDDSCYPYIMPIENSLNIDTELDLEYAEFLYARNLKNNEKNQG